MEPGRLKLVGHCPGFPLACQDPNIVFYPTYIDPAGQVALMVNLLGLAMKVTGMKPMDSVSQVVNLSPYHLFGLLQNMS